MAVGVSEPEAVRLAAATLDWRDEDQVPALAGAKRGRSFWV